MKCKDDELLGLSNVGNTCEHPQFRDRCELRVGMQRSHANYAAEFCCECTLISMIDGKSNTFLQSSCECPAAFQLFGADKGLMPRLLGNVCSSTE